VDRTASIYLPSSRKLVFMRHRQFLERKHKYHKMKRHFDNAIEKDSAPKWYTGKLLFEMVKNIQVVFEKGTIKGQKRKKTSIWVATDSPRPGSTRRIRRCWGRRGWFWLRCTAEGRKEAPESDPRTNAGRIPRPPSLAADLLMGWDD
jgi:hypothetical protein